MIVNARLSYLNMLMIVFLCVMGYHTFVSSYVGLNITFVDCIVSSFSCADGHVSFQGSLFPLSVYACIF
jgi:hypothetical protein